MTLSIRYQILAVIAFILLGAICAHLYLATSLVVNDKEAYVYDVNALLARTVSEEVDTALEGVREKVQLFVDSGKNDASALFAGDTDVISVDVYAPSPNQPPSKVASFSDEQRLSELNLTPSDLEEVATKYPVHFALAAAEKVLVENVSLPPDSALLRISSIDERGRVLVTVLRPDRLLHIIGKTQPHTVYLVDRQGQVLLHPDPRSVLSHQDLSSSPLVSDGLTSVAASSVREVTGDKGALLGAWARVPLGRLLVVTSVPKEEVFRATRTMIWKSVLFASFILCIAFFLSIVISRRLTRPISDLQGRMEQISHGAFGVEVPVTSRNELGALAESFNRMSRELGNREAQLSEANAQLVQSEKLSALGEMSAGIVHEVKNPMVAVMGFAELGKGSSSMEQCQMCFDHILQGANRANEILMSVLSFARPNAVQFESLDPKSVVQGAVQLVAHHLQLKGVTIHVNAAEGLPKIRCNANQLRQVLLNLMMNAGHAMEKAQRRELNLGIQRLSESPFVQLTVADTGEGMSEDVRKSLFKPFFTTKPMGKGTGLGLSVSRSIIEAHNGEISVQSEVGKGTTFTLKLPVAKDAAAAA